jgi:hypothetical protein
MPRKKPVARKKSGPKKVPIDPAMVEKLASQGLNKAQVAAMCGLGESQWYVREQDEPEISEAYKRGKAKGVLTISNALFEQAKSGNTTAQIFYLKCNGGWRENTRIEITGADGGPVKHERQDAEKQLLDKLAGIAARENKKAGDS